MEKGKNTKTNSKNNGKKNIKMSKGVSITLKIFFGLIVVVGVIGAGLLAGVTVGCVITTTPISKDQIYTSDYITTIYDDSGAVMLELTGEAALNREWRSIEDIPEYMKNAFIAIEDERFLSHSGVDIKRTLSAVAGFFVGSDGSHGGSTITQQVVKNVTGDDSRSVPRKIKEMWRAIQLEQDMEKDEILEIYANIIYFANNSYGVEVAAQTYFNKSVEELSLAECAFLAGIPNSPRRYNPATTNGRTNAYKRQITILDAMLDQGLISQEEYIEAIQTELEFHIGEEKDKSDVDTSKVYTYFEDAVITTVRDDLMAAGYTKAEANNLIYNSGIKIYTTQNTEIQEIVDKVYTDPSYFAINADRDPEDCSQSAITILDQNTGKILAMYGGYGEKTESLTYNRATSAKRQPGSAIKPILVYAPLIDTGTITAGTALDELPAHLDNQNPDRIWPSNWDKKVHGMINARYALMLSYNIPAATWFKDNINTCLTYLKNSGIDRTDEAYISTALGGLNQGVSTTEIAAAYGALANGGLYYEPTVYTKVVDRDGNILLDNTAKQGSIVYQNSATSTVITSMLTSVASDPRSMATYVQLTAPDGTLIPTAAKTGSTNDLKDYWLAGYTAYYTAVVWYGYDDSTPCNEQLESGTARILWKAVMQEIHNTLPGKDFTQAANTTKVEICTSSGKRATAVCKADSRASHWVYAEIYISGTEPTSYCSIHKEVEVCLSGTDKYGKYYLATENCTDTKTVVGQMRPWLPYDIDEYTDEMYPTDWSYELSHETCPNHPADGSSGEGDGDNDGGGDDASGDVEGEGDGSNSGDENQGDNTGENTSPTPDSGGNSDENPSDGSTPV